MQRARVFRDSFKGSLQGSDRASFKGFWAFRVFLGFRA